ncbi:MAG TPA: hypothetical protein VIU12_25575 [Chryseolinea sp.]
MLKRVYVPISLVITLMALVGFWRTYFGHVVTGTINTIPLIHFHAAVYVLWLLLFIGQVTLAATGHLTLHKRLGPWLMGLGVLVIVMGLAITFERFGAEIAAGNLAVGQRKLFGPLRDMVFFAPFLWAGWNWRHKPEIHKRLMIVATTILLIAAVGRMIFLGRPVPEWKFLLIWPLPVYIGMVHDFLTKKLIHPVYIIGIFAMLLMRLSLPLRTTELWLKFSGWLATLYNS